MASLGSTLDAGSIGSWHLQEAMSLQWHYLDAHGKEFGPFSGFQMRQWLEQGFFRMVGPELLVRSPEWRSHNRLCEVHSS